MFAAFTVFDEKSSLAMTVKDCLNRLLVRSDALHERALAEPRRLLC
jgi:hypothetical protein